MIDVRTTDQRQPGVGQKLLWCGFVFAFLIAYLPVFNALLNVWAGSEDNSHGFVIVPLVLYLLWQRREVLSREPVAGAGAGLVISLIALTVYLAAFLGEMQTLASLSLVLFIWGSVIYLLGVRFFRLSLFPCALLLFMVPVPSQLIAQLTVPLQLQVTKASVWLASLLGVPVTHEGNLIQLFRGSFEVVEACSGLRSIMALLTLGAIVSYLMLRSNRLRLLLFITAIPIAILINVSRLLVLILALHYGNLDLSRGTAHTVLGLFVFLLAITLFTLVGKGVAICER